MKTILMALMAALVGAGASGCVVRAQGHQGAVEVVVPEGHAHDDACGHYNFGARWYYLAGHRHGNGCGHVLVEGLWILGH